jgi:uncharacterized membrane protein YphA (DoxX/SURF4 family)
MKLAVSARRLPVRVATGVWILHSGIEKWFGDEDQAKFHHAMTISAFPFVRKIPPRRFVRILAACEIATGTVVLAPFISPALAGAALTALSTGLLTLYFRSPKLRKPGSVWPTFEGIAVSKDVWMLGIGLSLVADAVIEARRDCV